MQNIRPNVKEIRLLLKAAFDDVTLVSFCQDEFPEIYEAFANGQRLDQMINLVMSYFIRRADFMPLFDAIKYRSPDVYARFEDRLFSHDDVEKYPKIATSNREDWGEAVDVREFYGRDDDINTLSKWVIDDRCKLITVLGIGGIGKSSLTVKLVDEIKPAFEFFFWRDLRNGPSVDDIIDDCIKFLSEQRRFEIPSSIDGKLTLLLEILRNHHCLLVFDNVESVLQSETKAGAFKDGFEGYGKLIHFVSSSTHQSCLLLTSRTKPREITFYEGKKSPVRSYSLKGLDFTSAMTLLKEKGLSGTEAEYERLINFYAGNPLALNLVSATIADWFEGKVSAFFNSNEIAVFGDIEELIEQQLKGLTDTGKEIMYWLAIQREIVSLSRLEDEILNWLVVWREEVSADKHRLNDIVRPITRNELLETLESLRRRSLIEKMNSHFALQQVIVEYLTNQFTGRIVEEVAAGTPLLLRSHALIQAQAKDYIVQSQTQFILRPITQSLESIYGKEEAIEKLNNIINLIKNSPRPSRDYSAGNIINCLVQIGAELTGYDFSNLSIWQANLITTNLHNVNFSGSDLFKSTFAETFDLILSVAYSPDGKKIAAGSASGDILVWGSEDGQRIQILKGHTGWTRSVVFSPDSKFIASGSGDKTVRLWDVGSGQNVATLSGHTDWVRSVVFSPDGQRIASGGSDKSILIWDIRTQKITGKFEGHSNWIWSLSFSPDGNMLASGSNDKTIKLWDLNSGQLFNTLEGHTDWVTSVTFSPDRRYLASGSNDKSVRIWDAKTGKLLRILEGHEDRIWSVAFSPDNSYLASGSYDRTIRLWDMSTGTTTKTLTGHDGWVISVSFSPDSTMLVSGSEDQTVRLWDTKGRCLKTFQGHTSSIQSISFSPDSKKLASGGTDHIVRLWDVQTGESLENFVGHSNRIQSVDISPNGKFIASCGDDQTVRIWDIENNSTPKILRDHSSWIRSVVFSPDSNMLASSCDDLTVRLWDAKTGNCVNTFSEYSSWVATAAFSPDGKKLISGSADTTLQLWDLEKKELKAVFRGHNLRVNSVAFHPNGQLVASCSDDQTIRVWDVISGETIKLLSGHTGPLKTVTFSSDGELLASGGDDKIIKIWEVKTGNCLSSLSGHTNRVWAVRFAPNKEILASGSEDETIKIWSLKSSECIRNIAVKRIYEGMNIKNASRITKVQKITLKALGAIEV